MTDIEQKALALLNEVAEERGRTQLIGVKREGWVSDEALCRAIEQHEAFRQEVSDAVQEAVDRKVSFLKLRRFIIAKPVDPLVEVISELRASPLPRTDDEVADQFRSLMEDRGYEWRKIEGEG